MTQFLFPRGPEPWPPWPPGEDLPFDMQAGQVARLVVSCGGLDSSTSPALGLQVQATISAFGLLVLLCFVFKNRLSGWNSRPPACTTSTLSTDSSPCIPVEDGSPAEVPAFCLWSVSYRLEDHPQNSCSNMALELGSQKDSAPLSKTGSF